MKLKNIILLLAVLFASYSCDDNTKPQVDIDYIPIVLEELKEGVVVVTDENLEEDVLDLQWSEAESNIGVIVHYLIQVDKGGNFFANAKTLAETNKLEHTINGTELNDFLTKEFKQEPQSTVRYDIRIVAALKGLLTTTIIAKTASNAQSLRVTTDRPKGYPKLKIPGAHNGWSHDATYIVSEKFNAVYEGYSYILGEFKFSDGTNWDDGTNYGSSGTEGTLSTDNGAGNLSLTEGQYLLSVDTETLTWTSQKVQWALIGDATPNGWDADTPMTYDANKHVLVFTGALQAGEFKFRRDAAWAVDLGGSDGVLSFGGSNISVEAAGKYTITLDIFKSSDEHTYTITAVE